MLVSHSQSGKVQPVQKYAVSLCCYFFFVFKSSLSGHHLLGKCCTASVSCQSKSSLHCVTCESRSLSIKCPCRLEAQHAAAGRPRHSSRHWDVMTGPPRKGAGGCQGFDPTEVGDGCHPTAVTGDSWESPEPIGAAWVQVLCRWGGAVPSCRTSPLRRRGERQEVLPPSGPADLRSDGYRDRGRRW